jgi:thiol:disulfide interchange protein DsbD
LSEAIERWGHALGQTLQGQLETGSLSALAVVFVAGVLTSLTPCVYPMIPVTVTFIGGAAGGQRRRAVSLSVVYVVGLTLVYASLGVITALLGKTFGSFTRSPWIYGAVGGLVVLFGVAMLDWISIPVPGFFAGVQSQGARRGGHFGAMLMGLAAGFVAAPCTAPVLALLLVYVARTRDVLWGGTLLLVFSLGLGLLLMLLGIFSGMLASLPRAGSWMVWIKKGFGIGMLVVGAWFLYETLTMLFPAILPRLSA